MTHFPSPQTEQPPGGTSGQEIFPPEVGACGADVAGTGADVAGAGEDVAGMGEDVAGTGARVGGTGAAVTGSEVGVGWDVSGVRGTSISHPHRV